MSGSGLRCVVADFRAALVVSGWAVGGRTTMQDAIGACSGRSAVGPAAAGGAAERGYGGDGSDRDDNRAGSQAGGGQGHAGGRDASETALGDRAETADRAAEVIGGDLLDAGNEVDLGGCQCEGGENE